MTQHERDVARWAKRVKRATDQRNEAVAGRDNAIRVLRSDGATLEAIAALADLTHPAVRTICMRDEGDQ